jgi:hypothetical protein
VLPARRRHRATARAAPGRHRDGTFRRDMGWVRRPPSADARDVHCAPAGATKTIYLIRHAEGFHNRGATRATRRTRRARRLKSETVGDESRRKTTDGARRAPGAQRASETRRSTGARRTRTRDSRREDGDSANILKRRSSRATRTGKCWRRANWWWCRR